MRAPMLTQGTSSEVPADTRRSPTAIAAAASASATASSSTDSDSSTVVQARRPVRRRAARYWNDVLTTPGRMSVFALLAIIAVLTGGIVASTTITQRQSHHETLLAEVEPVANASQSLYSSLTHPSHLTPLYPIPPERPVESRLPIHQGTSALT